MQVSVKARPEEFQHIVGDWIEVLYIFNLVLCILFDNVVL